MPEADFECLVRVVQRIRAGWLPHVVGSSWWYGRPAADEGFRLWSVGHVPSMIVVDRMDADEAQAWQASLHPWAPEHAKVAAPIDGGGADDADYEHLAAVIKALHRPMDEEVELWVDGEDPDEHDHRFPECQDCEGHTYTIQVCQECGYTHNGETPAYRPWPCPTLRAAYIDGSDDA